MAQKIVDFHAHAFDEKIAVKATENLHKYYGIKPAADGRYENLLKSAEKSGVEKLVVCATATKPGQVQMINTYVSGLQNENIIGFGTLHPEFDEIDSELNRMETLGLHGIKFHPIFQKFKIDDEIAMRMFEKIGNRFPILIHMGDKNSDGTTPERLWNVMKEIPEITFIAAHLGGYGEWDAVKKFLIGKNLYFDTSSSVRFMKPQMAKELILAHGTDKILFGTDYPLSDHAYEMKVLKKLKLNEEDYEKIYWQNAYKLLNLE